MVVYVIFFIAQVDGESERLSSRFTGRVASWKSYSESFSRQNSSTEPTRLHCRFRFAYQTTGYDLHSRGSRMGSTPADDIQINDSGSHQNVPQAGRVLPAAVPLIAPYLLYIRFSLHYWTWGNHFDEHSS